MERKLAAILCADVYGYSRLIGENEEATLHTLTYWSTVCRAAPNKSVSRLARTHRLYLFIGSLVFSLDLMASINSRSSAAWESNASHCSK